MRFNDFIYINISTMYFLAYGFSFCDIFGVFWVLFFPLLFGSTWDDRRSTVLFSFFLSFLRNCSIHLTRRYTSILVVRILTDFRVVPKYEVKLTSIFLQVVLH
jgi:hypothetical protein